MTTPPATGAFTTVRSVGGLLPTDLLAAIATSDGLPGQKPADYGLIGRETLREGANRSFTRLQAAWADFRRLVPPGPVTGTETEATRNRWLRVLFDELGYGRLPTAPAGGIAIDGPTGTRAYPVSHLWERSPVHLLGAGVSLDHRTAGVPGAAGAAPHSMVQELLNRSPDLLWGFVSNGLRLRLLRDSASLVRQAYVEFDLEAMFDGEVFADFVLLWLVAHASRVEPRPNSDARPETCWLETWRGEGTRRGTRALTALRDGVTQALTILGRGFLRHPDNTALRAALADGTLPSREYYRLLLRVVYQLLVLFVAEDRDLLHPHDAAPQARDTYRRYFSTDRLRRLARRRLAGGRHGDLWAAHQVVLHGLGAESGRPELALPGLGGIYESDQLGHRAHQRRPPRRRPRPVRHPGRQRPAPIGGLPQPRRRRTRRRLRVAPRTRPPPRPGHRRVHPRRRRRPRTQDHRLLLHPTRTGRDPSRRSPRPCPRRGEPGRRPRAGPAGRHRLRPGLRLRALPRRRRPTHRPPPRRRPHRRGRTPGRSHPDGDARRRRPMPVRRGHQPLAAELAKVALWLEALDPGRPLSFLDAHIKVGNALIGTTPDLMDAGLPEDAFKGLVGDDPAQLRAYRKRNRDELKKAADGYNELPFADPSEAWRADFQTLARLPEDNLGAVHDKARRWRQAEANVELDHARLAADAWCAAFAWPHRLDPDAVAREQERLTRTSTPLPVTELRADPPPPTTNDIRQIRDTGAAALTPAQLRVLTTLRDHHRFFHWPLEFPDILPGGFSCVLGNPPWERVKLQDEEFFASRDREIAKAPNAAARKKMIAKLDEERPALAAEYLRALRDADFASHYAHDSGRYPLTGRGDINTFQIFAEHDLSVVAHHGRLGVILPTNIATGDTTAPFFRYMVETSRLAGFFDFENEKGIFPGVNNRVNFSLLVATGGLPAGDASFAFAVQRVEGLSASRFGLAPRELLQVNPNSGTAPVFRSRRDAEITIGIHGRLPVLIGDPGVSPWGVAFLRMFDMAADSNDFRTEKELMDEGGEISGNLVMCAGVRMLPLYEAKMLHLYDHRYATYEGATQAQINKGTLPKLGPEGHDDPEVVGWPRYWISEEQVEKKLGERWDRGWLLGWRDIARNDKERTMIASALPLAAVNHKFPLLLPGHGDIACLQENFSSLVSDYCVRQKLSGASLTFVIVKQLPVLPPEAYIRPAPWDNAVELRDWVADRVLELSYTSWDMVSYAEELNAGDGPPFRWAPERRAQLRAELDAAYLHLYGLDRDEAEHVLDSFFVLRKNEEKAFGEFRTRRLVLAAYDEMATGSFTSPLDPPPGDGPRHPGRSRA